VYYKARDKARSNGRQYHLAAILRRNGKVVKIGENTSKTHPRFTRTYADGNISSHMHAEMNVLRFSKPGDELEVMRFNKSGDYVMAKPCTWCMSHILKSGIKRVKYTNEEGDWICLNL